MFVLLVKSQEDKNAQISCSSLFEIKWMIIVNFLLSEKSNESNSRGNDSWYHGSSRNSMANSHHLPRQKNTYVEFERPKVPVIFVLGEYPTTFYNSLITGFTLIKKK